MSSTASAVRPLFEPTDLLDFFPTPPQSNGEEADKDESTAMDIDIELEVSAMGKRDRIRREMQLGSPPPDFEEEPEDWDEELQAMADAERERSGPKESPRMTFGESDILDFDQPIASSSRVILTPPPELDLDLLFEPSAPTVVCTLPPLVAETASGRTVNFKRRNKLRPAALASDAHRNPLSALTANLLSTPLHHLLREVDELKSQEKARQLQRGFDIEQALLSEPVAGSSTMWVDKYKPKRFSDLLGEDRVHREVMGWLKEWDKCVFKRANPVKKRRMDEEENPYIDALGRPRERILLLSGPPGYGKTTLGHIVARQAGYRTLEINASDDRSATTVSTRIKNAIDAGSGLESEGRPTCVIIDEIDGASGGGDASFVRSLIKLIQDVPARKRSNTPARPLRRPIICICNDLYATTLRPLRPFARVIRFRKPQAQFLVKRLRDICDRETLSADLRVLTALVEITSGDVRSCLNTLQFIKARSPTVTEENVRNSSVGLKDTGTTLHSVWSSLTLPISAKVRRKTIGIDDGKYVDRLAFQVQACGDYDKVVQGLFEHYPNLKPVDASFQNMVKLHNWLAYYDRLNTAVSENQEWELMAYLPYAVVPWYSHMAAPANSAKPVEWPKADYEAYQTRTVNEEVATSLIKVVPPILKSLFVSSSALTELIPFLMRIISPSLKPVNANIVKSAEKVVLDRLVELMIPLGLKFWQEKGENGQPMMRLEPPIDVFITYDGKRADDIAASRFAVRQLVAQAMDAELARRKGQAGLDGEGKTGTGAETFMGMYGVAKNGKVDNASKPESAATDFFGRSVVVKSVNSGSDEGSLPQNFQPPKKKFRAIYKFNEGSSSAVRKNIKMSALM